MAFDLTGVPDSVKGRRGVAIIATDDDPALAPAFELRDQLDDQAFADAWQIDDPPRFGALAHPDRPAALIRYQFTAHLRPWRCGGRIAKTQRIERAFLLDPTQIPAPLLRRFSERCMRVWVIPASVAAREHNRSGPGSAYDTLSRCLPLGVVRSKEPVRSIELALQHVAGGG